MDFTPTSLVIPLLDFSPPIQPPKAKKAAEKERSNTEAVQAELEAATLERDRARESLALSHRALEEATELAQRQRESYSQLLRQLQQQIHRPWQPDIQLRVADGAHTTATQPFSDSNWMSREDSQWLANVLNAHPPIKTLNARQ